MLENEPNSGATESSQEPALSEAEIVALQQALDEEKNKVDAHWQRLLRLQAEFENANRRASKDLENAHKYGTEKILSELLPILDSLERSLESSSEGAATMIEGVRLTVSLFHSLFERFNVKELNPVSQKFDPTLHEAIGMLAAEDVPPGTVVQVVQKGYQLHERVLRPARVMVSRAAVNQKVDEKA